MLGKRGCKFSIIPKSKEKYLSLSVKFAETSLSLRFIDTMHFLPGSLANWADKITDFRFIPSEKGDLKFKQYFPYSYFTVNQSNASHFMIQPKSIVNILKESDLPNEEAWFDDLNNEIIDQTKIEHARGVFAKYKCKNLDDYTKLYLEIDVLLIAEIFETFIDISMKRYKLDPSWFYTTPGYSWACAMYMLKPELELMTQVDMIEFLLDGIRGGISTACRKKSLVANNKYMKEAFNPRLPEKYIMYLDVTNLYGYAMIQKLPINQFEWLNNPMIYFDDFLNTNSYIYTEDDYGYILEVDIDYPSNLFEKHIGLPFAPEHINGIYLLN